MKCPRCKLENLEEAHFCVRCRTALPRVDTLTGQLPERPPPPPSTLPPGEVFAGRYRILEILGSGGMGRVYRVYDQELSMEVALKVLHPRFTLDDHAVERFRDELKLARRISHRNICRLYDIGRAGDQLFLSMELIGGETLRTLIAQRGKLPAGQALEILREMAEGLIEAHRHGIVHRDLKPQNVMVDGQGHVKVMDFGIAVSLHEERPAENGVVLGTPQYMAPEQVSGTPADHRVDVYALGIIGTEMLTGAPPFTGESAMQIACRQVTDAPPDPRQRVPDLPPPVCGLLRRMLAKDPGQRIPDMKSLVAELDTLLHPTSEPSRPRRTGLRGRRGGLLGLAALTILGATGLFLLWHRPDPAPPPKHPAIAVLYFRNNTGRPALDNWRTALADLLTTDLSQSLHLRMISSDRLVDLLERLKMQNVQSYSSADIHRLSQAEHFQYALLGSYSLAGDMFRIDVALKDLRNDEIVAADKTMGRGEESIFRMIDELTRRIKLGFHLSPAEIAGDIDHELGRVTTGSVAAYKFYQQGKELYRNRSFTESREAMRQAVAIDPEFALAHYWRAMDSLYLGDVEQAKISLKAAMDHLDRTSERERFLIRAFTATWLDNDPERAAALYEELLRLYPEDEPALIQLGSLHRNLQNWPQAEQVFTRLLAVNPRSRFGYENLCGIRQAQGRYVEALEVLRRGRPYVSDASWFPYLSAETRLLMGDAPAALQEARNAAVSTPKVPKYRLLTAAAFMLTGQEDDARREYREVLDRWPEVAGWEAILGLARLEMQYGRYLT
ncbi:MAG TPA: protein kinase, partial [Candidatus Aminicenantes bacterium]|nr:protein kinase [Candidatus Aminicenantes bacterium]